MESFRKVDTKQVPYTSFSALYSPFSTLLADQHKIQIVQSYTLHNHLFSLLFILMNVLPLAWTNITKFILSALNSDKSHQQFD